MEFKTYQQAIAFHGHSCPGLAIGYKMTTAALSKLSADRALDEELVAIVENDACGCDAVQFISGCTFGKGNFIFRDLGKSVYTFFSRATSKGVRVVFHGNKCPQEIRDDRESFENWILTEPADDMLSIETVEIQTPPHARIHNSINCENCSERTMETRIKILDNKQLCFDCFDKLIAVR